MDFFVKTIVCDAPLPPFISAVFLFISFYWVGVGKCGSPTSLRLPEKRAPFLEPVIHAWDIYSMLMIFKIRPAGWAA